jgi:S1-C subfamily serine protease
MAMKRPMRALAAAGLIAIGAIGGRELSISPNTAPSAAAQTAATTTTGTTPADNATQSAYTVANRSVVYVVSQGVGSGSGIIYDTNGDIVTNYHVVQGANSLSVTLSTGKSYPATVVGTDAADDLAVIRIHATNLTAATFARAGSYQIGQTVRAIGSPLGLKGSVTSGLISGLHRVEQEPNGAYLADAVQTSAPINPGNSGGALVSLNGTVVGMPTLEQTSSTDGTATQGIGFAIPSTRIVTIADQIIAHGKVVHTGRPYLGIAPTDATNSDGYFGSFGQGGSAGRTSGALVARVASGGPAARAGIQAGDIITQADETSVTDAQDLLTVIAAKNPGDTVKLTIDRNGTSSTVTVTLGELPA